MSPDCATTINTTACTQYALICLADRRDGFDKCVADGVDTQQCRADALLPTTPGGTINEAIAPYLLEGELSDRTKQLQTLNNVVWRLYKYVLFDFIFEVISTALCLFCLIYCCMASNRTVALKAFALLDIGISFIDFAIEARVLVLISSYDASVLSEDFTAALCFSSLEYSTATILMTDNLSGIASIGAVQIGVCVLSIILSLVTLLVESKSACFDSDGGMEIVMGIMACAETFTLVIQMLLCIYDFQVNARPLTKNFVKAIGGFVGFGTCVSIGSTDACEGPLTEPSMNDVFLRSDGGDAIVLGWIILVFIGVTVLICMSASGRRKIVPRS